MKILLTGGTGYIGSHVAAALISTGHQVVCFDNLANSDAAVIDRLEAITGIAIPLVVGDIRDGDALRRALTEHGIEAVIHFAGLKAVGESVAEPIKYYDNNVRGTLSLVEAMADCGVKTLVFSSSATVYGQPRYLPLDENHPTSATNPYGRTKLMIEEMLADIAASDPQCRMRARGSSNPVGVNERGLIGGIPNGSPNNLMPFISRVAAGRLSELSVFGNDYDTPDGTGVRDYIHVVDLADGHVAALDTIAKIDPALSTWNLGTGQGYSVLDMVEAFERVNGVSIPYRLAPRRDGDVASCYASPERAAQELGWTAQRDLDAMCASSWSFERTLAMRNSG